MTARIAAAFAGLGILAAAALGLYWKGRLEGAARERPKVEAAAAQAVAARLETTGERASAHLAEAVARRREVVAASIADVTRKALQSEDADAPLDPARVARLRAHDRELCLAAPGLAACAADRDARGGLAAVRAVSPARGADPG